MRTVITQKIDDKEIIVGISTAQIDQVKTEKKIKSLGIKLNRANRKALIKQHAIYHNLPSYEKALPEKDIERLTALMAEDVLVTTDGEVLQKIKPEERGE